MKQIEYILSLKPESNALSSAWEKTKEILLTSDVREVYEKPGRMTVRDVLANSKIHLKSLTAAKIVPIGMEQLIFELNSMPPQRELTCYGFASDLHSLIGSCYLENDSKLVGCVWIPLRKKS